MRVKKAYPHGSRVATLLGVPGLIVGLSIGIWVVVHYAGLDRIAIGGPEILNGTEGFGNPRAVAQLLFRDYLLPFEVTSVLILIAIMGAVVLAQEGGISGPSSYYLVLSAILFACGVAGF